MPESAPHIAVCICTLNRPVLLKRLLDRLAGQETGGRFTYSVIVADNDAGRSAEAIVAEAASRSPVEIRYASEPRRNIALARNMALRHADGSFAAFIDDDEFPEPGWLAAMLGTCEAFGVAGVLGPVRPHFEEPPPQRIIDGRFCERPEYPTGRVMPWDECRTGNVLFR
ncbi:MAG: glycosyltransferase family 2 protein, partial [Hyphomicrobium sp.]